MLSYLFCLIFLMLCFLICIWYIPYLNLIVFSRWSLHWYIFFDCFIVYWLFSFKIALNRNLTSVSCFGKSNRNTGYFQTSKKERFAHSLSRLFYVKIYLRFKICNWYTVCADIEVINRVVWFDQVVRIGIYYCELSYICD